MSPHTRHFFELLWGMTEKELHARYKNTIFGFLWLAVNPLLQMLVIGFIFQFFIKNPIHNYNYFLFVGLLVWNFFSLSLTKAAPSIVFERALIKKAVFPRAVIPLAIITSNLVHFVVALVLFVSVVIIILGAPPLAFFVPMTGGLFLLTALTIGLSLLTSALNVRYRDIQFFVQAALLLWFYTTPIIYTIDLIPEGVRWIWNLNPLTAAIQLFQHAILATPLPSANTLITGALITICVLFIGGVVFQKESKYFDDWI